MAGSFIQNTSTKVNWQGEVLSIQPRARVWRYLTDNRTHYLLGYNFFLSGWSSDGKKQFMVAISEKQQQKGPFHIGDVIEGTAWSKMYVEREFADYYKAGSLKLIDRVEKPLPITPPPFIMEVPSLQTYEERGARQLSKNLWESKCFKCIWANMSNVEIQWDFDKDIKKYRFETFCYGPKSCKFYKMGRPRTVPCKNMGTAIDDGYLDELCAEGRGYDD